MKKGQVIGYVGTTGNAPPDTPHLHFAVYRLSAEKHWWEGSPIDPYDVLRLGFQPFTARRPSKLVLEGSPVLQPGARPWGP